MSEARTRANSPVADAGQEPAPSKELRGLMPYLHRYTSSIIIGLVMVFLMGVVTNVLPLATGVMTDTLAGSPAPFEHSVEKGKGPALAAVPRLSRLSRAIPFYAPNSRQTVGIYCLIVIFCVAIKGVLSFSGRWILIGVSRDIEYDIRSDLLKRLLALEPEFYVRNRTGELMSRATNDLNSVRMVLGPGIMYSATTIVTMIMAIMVMVTLSSSLTLWVLLPAPVVAIAVWFFGKTIHELYEVIQAALATLTARVQENLSGVRIVRAYAQEEAEMRSFDEPNREYVSRNIRLIRTWSMFMPSLQALSGTSFLIVLWQGGRQPVLSDINFKIPAGSTLAVVGPTGCGKTTLAALVARLWEAPEGTVLIDGHPIQHWPLETLRRSIGYVPQDTYLFTETVGGNIAFSFPDYNPIC